MDIIVERFNKIKSNITSDLNRYGPKAKNINETLKYILVRNKWFKNINF